MMTHKDLELKLLAQEYKLILHKSHKSHQPHQPHLGIK